MPWEDAFGALAGIGYDRCLSFEPLVWSGGTVATVGGCVWRDMLPAGTDDAEMDRMLKESLAFVKGIVEKKQNELAQAH